MGAGTLSQYTTDNSLPSLTFCIFLFILHSVGLVYEKTDNNYYARTQILLVCTFILLYIPIFVNTKKLKNSSKTKIIDLKENRMKENIVFTGGGTAGHVMPNVALFPYFTDYQLHYIGSNGMEQNILSTYPNVIFHEIPTVKLIRSLSLKNLLIPLKLHSSINSAKRILKKLSPRFVFSKGGYVGLPVSIACKKLKIPLFLHESDKTLGLANKLAKNNAQTLFTAFDTIADKKAVYVGSPIRKEIYKGNAVRALNFLGAQRNTKPFLLFVCGSSGAKSINDFVFNNLSALTEKYNVIHLVGKNEKRIFRKKDYYAIPYANNIEDIYALASYVVTRGGANALSELIALKKLCVCIPLSKATRGDQIENAKYYQDKGALITLSQDDLCLHTLLSALDKLNENREKHLSAMRALRVDGTQSIVENIRKRTEFLAKQHEF
jgi:UDP-N-acetylglucosamine--N-acetylmuramyl-(pentapeptide) pyrophosphoryl-undecaprenol N-acetylglucosamine transferase